MTHKESLSRLTKGKGLQYFVHEPLFWLLVTLGIGLVLRLWGIDFGLPYEGLTYEQLTFEESKEVHRALKLGAGEYAWVFGKGGLYYLLFIEYGLLFVVSWTLGWVSDSQ